MKVRLSARLVGARIPRPAVNTKLTDAFLRAYGRAVNGCYGFRGVPNRKVPPCFSSPLRHFSFRTSFPSW